MWIDFDQLSDTARIWIYQSSRPLTEAEAAAIEQNLQPVVANWAAHGTPLLASAAVYHNRFVIIGADEAHHQPSGCSIDASVRWVREMGTTLNTDFFDRSVAYVAADGSVQTLALPQLKAAVSEGVISPDTLIFNNLAATKTEFQRNWQVKASESWMKRYFKNQVV